MLEYYRLEALKALTSYFNNGGDPNTKDSDGTTTFESLIFFSNANTELVEGLLCNKIISEETIKELQIKYPNDQTLLPFINKYQVV